MTVKYDFVPDENDKQLECIKILEGKHEGLIYQYGSVGFEEDEQKEIASLHFDYRVVEEVENMQKDELQELLGDVLVDILDKQLSEETSEVSLHAEDIEENETLKQQIEQAIKEADNERAENN